MRTRTTFNAPPDGLRILRSAQKAEVRLFITPSTYFRPRFARGEVPAPIPGGPALIILFGLWIMGPNWVRAFPERADERFGGGPAL